MCGRRRLVMMAIAFGGLVGGCGGSSAFTCQADAQCVGEGEGVCQPDGFCSFPAADCPSGQRYAEHSGPQSGECVGMELGSEATDAGPGTTSPTASASESSVGLTTEAPTTSEPTTSVLSTGEPGTSSDGPGDETTTGEPVDPDLVLWLELEPAPAGDVPDSSSYMGHGMCTPPACPELGPGVDGQGVQLDGIDDVMFVPPSPQLETTDGFTVALWIRLSEPPLGHHSVVGKPLGADIGNTWELYFYDDVLYLGMLSAAMYAEVSLVGPFPVDEWIHLAGTWDGAESTLWFDGQPVGSAKSPSIEFDDHPVMVGADDDHEPSFVGYFLGGIDDVRVYRRALTPDELAGLASG